MTNLRFSFVLCIAVATTLFHDSLWAFAGDDKENDDLSVRYKDAAEKIITAALKQNDSYEKLEELCDDIGHRLTGSPQLEKAVEWAQKKMRDDGQENVRAEPVTVTRWTRGSESLEMISPHRQPLAMLGLGMSIGTPKDGITAGILVVADEAALETDGSKAKGKIVLFNNPMPEYDPESGSGYGTAVRFRHKGAKLAAAHGAVACLVRSVTARSLRSPHTGSMDFRDEGNPIPAAAVSVEDAEMISRLAKRGIEVRVHLQMSARTEGPAESANVIGELRGREKPEEVVVIGGHLDSWDVGQGAHDDGAGCVMAMEAINVLRKLKMTPRRTIRVVLWTNEENGLAGGRAYAAQHAEEMKHHVAAIESDSGGFAPRSFSVECSDETRQKVGAEQLEQIVRLLEPLGVEKIDQGHSGADVSPMKDDGVMLMGLSVEGSKYFDYHHSQADTLDKVNPRDLSQCTAAMAVMSYILADMPDRFGGDTSIRSRAISTTK